MSGPRGWDARHRGGRDEAALPSRRPHPSPGAPTPGGAMRIRDCNWMQAEALLARGEDRAILPLGSIEQHAYLSLAVDALLAQAVAVDAAAPLGVPVFPAQPYGYTPTYMAYPGTLTLRLETLVAVIGD